MDDEKFIKDDSGNILCCPKCGSRNLGPSGMHLAYSGERQRRYKCKGCHMRTVAPNTYRPPLFDIQEMPRKEMDIDDILNYRGKKFKIKSKEAEFKRLIDVDIKVDGVIGLCHFGDPHVDDDGTNLHELFGICDKVNTTEGMFAGNLGDVQNNWIGRLASLYSQQSTTAKESWVLTEFFLNKLPWLYLVGGNHDVWSGEGDPLEFIMRSQTGVYQNHGTRLNLKFPNGKKVRVNARHTFKGHSMWNTAHGICRAVQMGWRDHILTAGHTHVSGYQVLKDPATGLISHAIQVGSFKRIDQYADKMGLDDRNIFNCPVTIIDPKYADDDNRLVTTIFDPYEAADYLTWKRSRK